MVESLLILSTLKKLEIVLSWVPARAPARIEPHPVTRLVSLDEVALAQQHAVHYFWQRGTCRQAPVVQVGHLLVYCKCKGAHRFAFQTGPHRRQSLAERYCLVPVTCGGDTAPETLTVRVCVCTSLTRMSAGAVQKVTSIFHKRFGCTITLPYTARGSCGIRDVPSDIHSRNRLTTAVASSRLDATMAASSSRTREEACSPSSCRNCAISRTTSCRPPSDSSRFCTATRTDASRTCWRPEPADMSGAHSTN